MNLTDFNGELVKEKEKLYEVACNYKGMDVLEDGRKTENNSYLIRYEDARHTDGALTEYESGEMEDFKVRLDRLWSETDMDRCIPILQAAYLKSMHSKVNMIHTVDLYNYTM